MPGVRAAARHRCQGGGTATAPGIGQWTGGIPGAGVRPAPRGRHSRLDWLDRHSGPRHRPAQSRPVPGGSPGGRRRPARRPGQPGRRVRGGGGGRSQPGRRGEVRDALRSILSRTDHATSPANPSAPGCPAGSHATSPANPQVLSGPEAVSEVAAWPCDVVLNGVTGAAGLRATLAALDAGRVLALANKESLIIGGPLVTSRAKPGQIVPVDSEHSTIAQCLRAGRDSEVRRLVLTASGGPFRGWSRDRLAGVTPKQALAHPTWNMGPLVTINSATLVNKGLEVIEAHLLFGFSLGPDRRGSAPAVDRALDGGILRWRHDHPGVPAGHAAADLAGPGLARPGARGRAGTRLVDGGDLDVRAARRRCLPGGRAGPRGGRGWGHRACCVQRGERGVRGGLPGWPDQLPSHSRHRGPDSLGT